MQGIFDQRFTAKAAEHQGEQRRTDEDEEHHGGDFGGAEGYLLELGEIQLALGDRQQGRAQGTDRSSLGRCGVTGENRAEHCGDQRQRWQQRTDQLAPFDRPQFFLRQGGQLLRLEDRYRDEVEDVHADQHEARDQRADEQVADRHGLRREDAHLQLCLLEGAGHHIAEQDQDDRGWNDLTEGAGGGEGAGSDRRVVAATQHGRQCQQAHSDHGGADDTGAGRKQRADHADRNRQAATHGAEQPRHRFQQVFGDARFLQHHPHEDEQRYRQHRLVVHDAEDAVRQRVQITHVERAGDHADAGEQECHAAEGKGDRITGHQSEADADEQQDGHDFTHASPPALLQANDRPGGSRP